MLLLIQTVNIFSQVNLTPGVTVIIQAEDVTLFQAETETEHSGYTGSSYVNFENEAGGYIEWSVNVFAAADADCIFIFANGGSTRPVEMRVNGNVAISSYDFPATDGWTSWSSESMILGLLSGNNTIRMTGIGDEGGPNIDRLDITVSGGETANPGDANEDGAINIVDALVIAQYYVGFKPESF